MLPFFAILTSISVIPPLPSTELNSSQAKPLEPSAVAPESTWQEAKARDLKPAPPSPPAPPIEVTIPQTIRALPGELDDVPVFNSNNPEIIRNPGILLSTFPAEDMKFPEAHLDFSFKGRFDIFSHHIAKSDYPEETPTLYLGILIKNASSKRRNVIDILQGSSYLGTPDAPYINLPPQVPNDVGRVYSGPGGRVSDVILRGIRQTNWAPQLELEPDESIMLMNLPIPLPTLGNNRGNNGSPGRRIVKAGLGKPDAKKVKTPSSNARSTLLRMKAKKEVYVASMAMFAPLDKDGREQIPTLKDWQNLLINGNLIQPRDRPPSELNSQAEKFYYGRVSGVSRGSVWESQVTDNEKQDHLTIPSSGQSLSFGIATLQRGTFGTNQIQSAPMLVRYPDTAYLAHGNYGVRYQLTLPLLNPTSEAKTVNLSLQTPVKDDDGSKGLTFYRNPPTSIFFRGTVRLRYKDDNGTPRVKYFHLVHRRGEMMSPLLSLTLPPNESRLVSLDFVYPPDATPPQVLTLSTN